MNTIFDTESYMPGVLNKFLRANCLNDFMENNQYYQEKQYYKTRNFKVYDDYKDLENNFRTGMMLSGVIVKSSDGEEGIYVCYKGITQNQHVLHRLEFDDSKGITKFNLYYAAIKLTNEVGKRHLVTVESRNLLIGTISGYVIIHPMVTRDMKFKICNGHTVLTYCWRVRTANGLCDFLPNVLDFVIDE